MQCICNGIARGTAWLGMALALGTGAFGHLALALGTVDMGQLAIGKWHWGNCGHFELDKWHIGHGAMRNWDMWNLANVWQIATRPLCECANCRSGKSDSWGKLETIVGLDSHDVPQWRLRSAKNVGKVWGNCEREVCQRCSANVSKWGGSIPNTFGEYEERVAKSGSNGRRSCERGGKEAGK